MSITLILAVIALVLFLIDAAGVPSRIGLQSLGLALCVVAYFLVGGK